MQMFIEVEYKAIFCTSYNSTKYPGLNRQETNWAYTKAIQGLYSLSGKTSYRKISWSLEAAKFVFRLFPIALKLDNHLGSNAAEMPVKFQNDTIIITPNLAASRLREIWR